MKQGLGNSSFPWYKSTFRWGQTNLTEIDPLRLGMDFWRDYWKKTSVQGVIINAGGIVAYYPSSNKLQYRAAFLGDRDILGEFSGAARNAGLIFLARMDSNRATKDFYDVHSDWFSLDVSGMPYTSGDRYIACINSPYYKEYIPELLEEIIRKYRPDGFADNSWTGLYRDRICYCGHCRKKFKKDSGYELPLKIDWNDPVYKIWVKWSYSCRTENWDLFNEVTRNTGGEDCLWIGMINANPVSSHCSFCDLKEVGKRSHIVLCDHQSRDDQNGFEQNSLNGYLLHGLAGWEKIIPESMANYVRGERTFRLASNPPEETRIWMLEGFAGGLSPWYHHIGAAHEDRRQFANVIPVMQWHEKNQDFLYERLPLANAGLVWNQDNIEFYGRENANERVALPWHGFVRAMTRARIPFIPVHADHIERDAEKLDVLILPDISAMSDSQCLAIKNFIKQGKSLIFTGTTATMNEWGEIRNEFPLKDLTGITPTGAIEGVLGKQSASWEHFQAHNYLRIDMAGHGIFNGIEDTGILPFGGCVRRVESNGMLKAVATYIPEFPIYPPEFSWMRQEKTDLPVILAGTHDFGGRIVYFAGDIDRCYGRTHLPDLGSLLSNAILWALDGNIPMKVEGPGYLDCKIYKQGRRFILHLVNLSGCNMTPGYVEEVLPVGPLKITVKLDDFIPATARYKVSGVNHPVCIEANNAVLNIDKLHKHEMIVLE